MFKSFFKKEDDEDIFETVDPIVEQRRNEKFSKPLIYDEEFEEKKKEIKQKKEEAQPVKKEPKVVIDKEIEKKGYEMMEVISPIYGLTEEKNSHKSTQSTKKKTTKKMKKRDYSLVQVISPFYGNFDHNNEDDDSENEAVLTSAKEETVEEKKEPETIEEVPTVEENLRNIAKIVEEEQDQLKIIEERTGEFKLDFGTNSTEKQGSLIDEIDDNMSLDELMSLYEKKFKD